MEMKKINSSELSIYIGEYPYFRDEWNWLSALTVLKLLKQSNEAIPNFFETASLFNCFKSKLPCSN